MAAEIIAKKARRVLVVFAHPDDAEFTVGGSLAKWAAEGSEIYYAVCTDGSKGSDKVGVSAEELALQRQSEQREAAMVLGVKEVTFLGHTDGELTPDPRLKVELVRLIRALRPDTLLTWDPWRPYQLHSDHRMVGQAALDAVMAAASPRYFPEQLGDGLQPHRADEVYLFGTDSPDIWVDIGETFTQKIEAIAQHVSQIKDIADIEREIGDWNRSLGESKGFTYAEAFKVLRPHCEICR
jgi:LmbE family N-acetylglucosaminyl deacetylase